MPKYSVSGTWEDYLGIDRQAGDAVMLSVGQDSPFEELVRKYGVIDQGMDPRARDINVPTRINETDRVSVFSRSLLESQHIDDEVLPAIEQMVADGVFGAYQTVTNETTLQRADDVIAEKGGLMNQEDRTHAVYNSKDEADRLALADKIRERYQADATSGGKFGFESDLRQYKKMSGIRTLNSLMKRASKALEREDIDPALRKSWFTDLIVLCDNIKCV